MPSEQKPDEVTDAEVAKAIGTLTAAIDLPKFSGRCDLYTDQAIGIRDLIPRLVREKAEARDKALSEPRAVLASLEKHGGCGDGYCVIGGRAKGQHTNGGCKCYRDEGRVRLAFRALLAFRRSLSPKPDTILSREGEG